MKKIGILGGTFDPPHLGHLIIAEEVRISLGLEEIWFIPSNEPPHKAKATINANNRITMLELATKSNPLFKVKPIELERKGKSYTIDTMKLLVKKHPDTEFYFIIGADMVEYLPHWHKIDELVHLVTFVGVMRPGYQLKSSYPIITVNIPAINISSTMLRERLQNKQSVRYLIPANVYTYIKEKEIYED